MMEKFVGDEVDRLIMDDNYKGCRCERCIADMIALALNSLPAKYVVTEKGAMISKVVASLPQNQVDVLAAVVAASKVVEKHPRH